MDVRGSRDRLGVGLFLDKVGPVDRGYERAARAELPFQKLRMRSFSNNLE